MGLCVRDIAVFLIVFGLLPVAFVRTSVGVLLWNWIGFMNPHRLGWGPAVHFKFAYIIGIVTLAGLLFTKERKPIPNTPLVWVLGFFICWMCFTTYQALVPDDAFFQWKKVMKIQLFIFVGLMVMQSRAKINQWLWVIVLSIAFFGVKGGFFTLTSGGHFLVLGPRGSQIEDNNTLALSLIMILPLMWYLANQVQRPIFRWIMYGFMGLIMVSVFGSHSRGALLAFSAIVFILILKSQHKVKLLALLALVLPVMLAAMPAEWFDRMKTIKTYQEDASAMGRINAWHFAYNLAKDRPFVGGGFETFRPGLFEKYAPNPEDYHDSHSIYFEVLGEHGFFGLSLFLTILWLSWRLAGTIQKRTRGLEAFGWAYDLAKMLQVSIVGYAVGGTFLGVAYFDLFYCLVAILILTYHEVNQSIPAPLSALERSRIGQAHAV